MSFTTRAIRIGFLAGALLLVVVLAALLGQAYLPVSAGYPGNTADLNNPPPPPDPLPQLAGQASPAAVSTSLSYYFISGNEFTPNANVGYVRQVTGCVNQMPENIGFTAGVHLPTGSVVQSITLYSYNSIASASSSGTAYFILNDNIGVFGGAALNVQSPLSTIGYTQTTSAINPWTIDNQKYSYSVEWRKIGLPDSTYLSLCGVRVAYYAPLGAIYLPAVVK